jgi:hypothetical protein
MKTKKRKPKVHCIMLSVRAENFSNALGNTIVGVRHGKMDAMLESITLSEQNEFNRLAAQCFRELMHEIYGKDGK